MYAFRVAYDGAEFSGFQRQPDVPTVEATLFGALHDLGIVDGGPPEGYSAAGRTDAGVSAVAQTVAFEAPSWLSPRAFNSELPAAVRTWARTGVGSTFHATTDPLFREYVYYLYAPSSLDRAVADDVLDRLTGTHDFHNLTSDTGDTTRTVHVAESVRRGPFLEITVRADGFLRHLVRRMVSLVELVASGERDYDVVDRILSSAAVDGASGVPPLEPEPLLLTDVAYSDLTFEIDEEAVDRAQSVFDARSVAHLAGARVAERVSSGLGDG